MFTLGFAVPAGGAPSAIVTAAGATGLVIVTLQIAYLPSLYAAFNRRETEVALLNARAGVPSWGPELLARTHYALGSGGPTIDTLPDLYARWEVWVADVAESHTTYLHLVRHPGARWRVNYEQAAYALAADLHAVPALWSGERRPSTSPIPPIRPPLGRPPK